MKADYDFTQSTNSRGGRIRRPPRIEKKDEDSILSTWKRQGGVNLARDMWRNAPQVHGMLKGLRVNIIGWEGKLRFYRNEPWYKAATNYFNKRWSKHADYVDGSTWKELAQLTVYAIQAEGDFVAVFDDGILSGGSGSGRIATWEADQVVNLEDADFKPLADRGFTQNSGVVKDANGRICGVIVSSERGQKVVPKDKALVLVYDTPEEWEASPVRLVNRKYRLRQARGVADAIPSLQTQVDISEILASELVTAKLASKNYGVVFDPPSGANGTVPTGYADVDQDDETTVDTGDTVDGDAGDQDDTGDEPEPEPEDDMLTAPGLSDYMDGFVDYLPNGADVKWAPADRPNAQLPPFLEFAGDMVGASFGLYSSLARMKSQGSYTSFRGDLVCTERTYEDFRQWWEDRFADWVAESVIQHAVSRGVLEAPPDPDWADYIAWTYPPPVVVDETKDVTANTAKLKAGLVTYQQLLGPAWEEQLEQVAKERKALHRMGLQHPQDETVAGVPVGEEDGEQEGTEDEDN